MATSEVSICNLALQKLGAIRITALTDNSRNARAVAACYEQMRDRELRAHVWNFAKSRAQLAASGTAPAFDFNSAFPVPSDFLRLNLPNHIQLDWTLELHEGQLAILTNDSAPLNIPYIAKITDPTLFDPLFVEALACKIAANCCEEITQSNEKKKDAAQEYKDVMSEARHTNAIENIAQEPPIDTWDQARILGTVLDNTKSGYLG